jgi:hypothetical protein
MAPTRKPQVPLVRPGEKMASKPKEKPKSTELLPKASVSCLRATRKKSTQETDTPDPDTSDWKTVKQTVKHHQTREGTLKKDVKCIMPLINAIVTKGKKFDGKKIEQWITVKRSNNVSP